MSFAWCVAVLAVEVLLFFRTVLITGRHLIPWDLQYYHLPLAWFASRSLARGELPLWDPYSYCGMPVYANLTVQLFYPPAVAAWLVSNLWGSGQHLVYMLEALTALHVLGAGVFALLLLRRLGAGTAAALTGATVYQLGAYFASQTQHLGAVCVGTWLPLVWLAVIEIADRPRRRWVAILGVALALTFLSGFPAAAAPVYGSAALLTAALWLTRRTRWTVLAWFGAGCVLSVLLSGAQLLPTMELSGLSVASLRAEWMDSGGGLPIGALATLLWPNRYGVFEYSGATWKLPWNPTFLYLYCGIPALVFASVALWRRSLHALIFGALAIVTALWMLGDSTPIYRVLFLALPAKLRASLYAEFAMVAFTLALAVLAGLGADAAVGTRSRTVQALAVAVTALDLIAFSSARPINSVAVSQEPGITHDHWDRFPEVPRRMRELVNQSVPPWRIDTMQGSLNWSSSANILEVPTANGDDPFALIRYMQVRESFTGGERWGRYYEVRDPDSPILKLLNVRYVVSNGAIASPGGLVKREELPGNVVWENRDPQPRFFLVARVRPAAGMDDAGRLLRSGGLDLRTEAVVEGAVAAPEAAGTVRVLGYGARDVALETESAGASFLVTSEAWYPGWRATIDGREAALVLTNAAFRGLAVPAGRHRVEMRFAPPIFWKGAAVSAVGLLLLVALLV